MNSVRCIHLWRRIRNQLVLNAFHLQFIRCLSPATSLISDLEPSLATFARSISSFWPRTCIILFLFFYFFFCNPPFFVCRLPFCNRPPWQPFRLVAFLFHLHIALQMAPTYTFICFSFLVRFPFPSFPSLLSFSRSLLCLLFSATLSVARSICN